ncbi:MAG: T9SS type A sorting domain-containing protein, partial [Rhodothermales bacterium]
YNTGGLFWRGSGNLYEVPAYGGVSGIFAESIWIGGMVGGELRVTGTTYGPFEFFPGPLDESGNPPEDCTPYDRIFVVSEKDMQAFDAGLEHTSDIDDWPWHMGAPVDDGDGDPGNYNLAGGDRPRVTGHQTAWWVMNDAAGEHGSWRTAPIDLELQMTAFAASAPNALDNTTFYRYKFIYKGAEPMTDARFGIWVDPDLGNASDDYVGSDTTLDMGYVYNGDNDDQDQHYASGNVSLGYRTPPPALGHVIVQGPFDDEDGRDNDRDGKVDESGERLGMTTFLFYNSDSSPLGHPFTAQEAYGYLRAIWKDGIPMTVGGNGYGGSGKTTFNFPGDPVTGSFWSEVNTDGQGTKNSPADRRMLMSTGPFSMEPGDEEEIVVAIVWSRGADYLDSVRRLREDAAFVREAYASGSIDSFPVPHHLRAPNIEVAPSELSFQINPGQQFTQVLTITNTGSADLQWNFEGPPTGIGRFLTTANGAGPLEPPDTGTFSFNSNGFPTPDGEPPHCSDEQIVDYAICNDRPSLAQQVGPGRFGINAGGGNGTYQSYLDRSVLGGGRSLATLGSYDYEWRFTGSSLALRWFEDEAVVEVPFELWRTGIKTPDDFSDDVRLIPLICEVACGGGSEPMVFDFGGDHGVSGGANDPLSDWIYWYAPKDMSAGDQGYRAYAQTLQAGDPNSAFERLGDELLARQVLVNFNAGTEPLYPQPLPEPGTIFRIETAKSWVQNEGATSGNVPAGNTDEIELTIGRYLPPPGFYQDTLRITSRVPGNPEVIVPVSLEVKDVATAVETSETPTTYALHQNYPNPFNPATTIRFDLPVAGQVRLSVFDVLGRRASVLVDEHRSAGRHDIVFEASDLPAGVYFVRLESGRFRDAGQMLLVK